MAATVELPIQYFANPSIGRPLFGGKVYVGEADKDPTISGNQVQLYVVEEDGTRVAVSQPLTLGAGGVPLYNGSPVQLSVDDVPYSILIADRNDQQEYYVASTDGTNIYAEEVINKFKPSTSGGETSINVPDAPQYLNVYVNGVLYQESDGDYTYNPSTGNVGLSEALESGDVVEIQYGDIVTPSTNVTDKVWVRPSDEPYNATGDGTTIDTADLQSCFNAETAVLIDKPYAVDDNVNIPKSCHVTCVGDGKIIYKGPQTNPLTIVINVQAESFGTLILDGDDREFQGIRFDNSKSYATRGDRCVVSNMYTDTLPANTPIAVFNSASEIDVGRIECYDFDQGASVTNGSVPQGFVTSGGGVSRVGSVYGKNVHALVLPASDTDEVHIGHIVHKEGKDQAIYNLGGTLTYGQLDCINCKEEIVVNRATLIGGDINVTGFGFPVLRIETAEYTKVGNIHGAYPRGTAEADIPENVPRGVLGFRINNGVANSGPVIIESVTGTFNRLLARTGDGVGTCESLRIGSIDCDLYFRGSDTGFAFDNWWDLRGAERVTLGDCKVRIRDIEDFVNSGNPKIFSDFYYDGSYPMQEPSEVSSFRVKILDSSGSVNPFATYQGQRGEPLLRFHKSVWQTNTSLPYRREDNLGPDGVTINPQAPSDGYWLQGDTLDSQNFDGGSTDDNNIVKFICTASGTPGTWLRYTPFLDQTGSPIGAVTPDFRGQIYRELGSSNVFVSVGLTDSDWIQIGEEV